MKKIKFFLICIVAGSWLIPRIASAQVSSTWSAKLNIASLFSIAYVSNNGIIGTVNRDGHILVTVKDHRTQTIMYRVTTWVSTSTFAGEGDVITPADAGPGAGYYPNTWFSKNIKDAAFGIDRYYYDSVTNYPYHFLYNPIDVDITIETLNAQMILVKIPGIGIIDAQGGNSLFDPSHYCYDLTKTADCQCAAWAKIKQPDVSKNSDLIVAAHRGIWGYDLGSGNPENSISSLRATPPITPVLESDVMITKDDSLIVSHDYNLNRESDYTGSDNNYLFNMYMSQVRPLKLRRRNDAITEDRFLSFDQLMQAVVANKLVLTIDIKDIRARYGKDPVTGAPVCVDNCDYDNSEAGKARTLESWKKIFTRCVEIAKARNALSYIAFKVGHDYSVVKSCVSEDDLSKILFMPVIQPPKATDKISRGVRPVDAWNNQAGNRVVAYETNFKQLTDVYLQPFEWNGVHYQNLLDYVYNTTGLRPGCYPEEPMGPRGIVNRWAEWIIKDPGTDMRGDHYKLMAVPYGKIMVLTTDRPDIWDQIQVMYNK